MASPVTADPRSTDERYVLSLGCPDRTGIVAEISSFLAQVHGSIVEAAYYADPTTGWFFTRQAIRADSTELSIEALREAFTPVAEGFGNQTEWKFVDTAVRKKVVIVVSKEGHCLLDILGRVASGELPIDVRAVIGNHHDLERITEAFGIPFHYIAFPANRDERGPAFDELRELVDVHEPDAVVLARFMQILPPELCEHWAGTAINIHHSFLPSFVGARPYHQAFDRGVKLIGATCHYVTPDLDAGPIIEQDVMRIDHSDAVPDIVRQGRDIEKLVLARGLRWHIEDRILIHENKTVIFD